MSSVYIHIPFCHRKCHYCNFFSLASGRLMNGFASAICNEAIMQKHYLDNDPVETIYFGGGTPSMLPAGDIEKMLCCLHEHYTITEDAEVSLEANPEDVNGNKLKAYRNMGVNRLSIGIQSFRNEDLQYLHRKHDARQAFIAVDLALEHGFQNLSLDLIYGIPTLDMQGWRENLGKIAAYRIPHLSAYALTVEPNTILHWRIARHIAANVMDESAADQFVALMQWADDQGYENYEISNFCLPGMRSRHNSGYWNARHYLGLGPSAHSFDGRSRQWNISNLQQYMLGIDQNKLIFEKEVLTPSDQHNEFVMTALRTIQGIDLKSYSERFGVEALQLLHQNLYPFFQQQWVQYNRGNMVLTRQGKLFADRITSALFW
ncbi:MAG: radical SAM family heme chaperone HemW [Bacteroidales bacterium]|nr:radical SAM family heme chaperone HemW [Bacteroidales bacterium]